MMRSLRELNNLHKFIVWNVVKAPIGRRSQVANGHLGWAQMSNETSHWSFRPRLNGPPSNGLKWPTNLKV